MRTKPSVILIREWEEQLSGSGCCGRVEGDFLTRQGEPVFRERRACMEAMAPLSRTLRERFGDAIELQVLAAAQNYTEVAGENVTLGGPVVRAARRRV